MKEKSKVSHRGILPVSEGVSAEVIQGDGDGRKIARVVFDGLEVCVFRSLQDGMLVTQIISSEVGEEDEHQDTGVPKLRVYCNDARIMDNGEDVPLEEQGQ